MNRPVDAIRPAAIDGVGPSTVRLPQDVTGGLLDFLDRRFPDVGRAVWRARLQAGTVRDAHDRALALDAEAPAGGLVHYFRDLPDEPRIPFEAEILYRDAHLLVADKPHFLPTIPSGRFVRESLLVRLKQATGIEALTPLHRLDRETAGLVLFSVDPATRGAYTALFAERQIEKTYEALAPLRDDTRGPLTRRSRLAAAEPFFRMQEVPGEPNAETRIEPLASVGVGTAGEAIARYRLSPRTGRKHQLRVHMAALGMPIVNDRWYPALLDDAVDDFRRPLKLLARQLRFVDPLTAVLRVFDSRRRLDL